MIKVGVVQEMPERALGYSNSLSRIRGLAPVRISALALVLALALPPVLGGRCVRLVAFYAGGTLYTRDGPFIPTGVYFWPDYSKILARNPFEDVNQYGMNTLVAYYEYVRPDRTASFQPDLLELRTECDRLGMHFFIGAPNLADLEGRSDAELDVLFAATSDRAINSDLFLGWMFDEPIWNGINLALMTRAVAAIRRVSPRLSIWINYAPVDGRWGSAGWPDMVAYTALADIVGFDFYPVDTGLPWVGTISRFRIEDFAWYVDLARSWAGPEKPVWMLQQGFRSGDFDQPPSLRGTRPDGIQTRFMSFDALVHGASGIFYFPGSRLIFPIPLHDPSWDVHIRATAAEIAGLRDELGSLEPAEHVQASNPEVRVLVRRRAGRTTILAVREAGGTPVAVDFQLAETATGQAAVYSEGRWLPIADGRFSDIFEEHAVHVYQIQSGATQPLTSPPGSKQSKHASS